MHMGQSAHSPSETNVEDAVTPERRIKRRSATLGVRDESAGDDAFVLTGVGEIQA